MKKQLFLFGALFFIFFLALGPDHLFSQKFSPEEEWACQLLAKGKIDQAIETLEKNYIPAFPHNLSFLLYLGLAHYLRGDFEKAYKELKKVDDELNDKRVSSLAPQGTSIYLLESSQAMSQSQAILSEQNNGLLYFSYGLTLKDKNNIKSAEKKFQMARKNKYDPTALSLQLFDLYLSANKLENASQELAQLKQALGDSPTFTLLEGCLLYRRGQIDDSLAAFEKVKDSLSEARLNMGLIQYNRGDYQKALDIWTGILSSAPGDKEALLHAGQACARLGNKERAREYFEKTGMTIPAEEYYPKMIPLSLGALVREVKFQFPCK
jgi:tetratricopeptide (TPR) repeat protein